MVDIQSVAAEIRRGKKDRRKKPQGKNIMSASATQGGHNKRLGTTAALDGANNTRWNCSKDQSSSVWTEV